jgi:hypothetical protein
MGAGNSSNNNLYSKVMSASSKMSMTSIFIILAIILFIGLIIYYYYIASKNKTYYTANNEYNSGANSSTNKQAELMLFYVDWCPHCKTAKPVWEEIKSQYQNKSINGYNIIFTEINCTNETADIEAIMNKYKIEGFPTIKLLKDGQIIEYDAKPSKETLNQFLNTVL